MELTLENKAKFFAQYWGQKIGKVKMSYSYLTINKSCFLNIDYLELKPLSSITDEDAEGITIYWAYKSNNLTEYGYTDIQGFKYYTYNSVDYLRSKGYAMPFHDLRVEQMVEAGWIKLKS